MARTRFAWMVRFGLGVTLLGAMTVGTAQRASAATILYVKADATGANNGTSWADAYTDLPTATAAAASGDQIWVAEGLYKPTTTTDRTISFYLKNGVGIYGGFVGTETLLNQRAPISHPTILSGDIGAMINAGDNSYHVVNSSNTNSTATLDGFTIRDGNANGPLLASDGGGVINLIGNAKLRNLIIRNNRAAGNGGGMYSRYNDPGDPTLRNVRFIRNFAGHSGGGMFILHNRPALSSVTFNSNRALGAGGGMAASGSSPVLVDVTFAGNQANIGGGMWNNDSSTPILKRATFSNNTATQDGGALYNRQIATMEVSDVTFGANAAGGYGGAIYNNQSTPTFRNITVSGNTTTTGAGGMYDDGSSIPTVIASIFWGDSTEVINAVGGPAFSDSIVAGGCPVNAVCTNVTNADPVLGALKWNGGSTYTMALGAGSAAIDSAGINAACVSQDQRGLSRPQGLRCDDGAYEVGVMEFYSVGPNDGDVLESGPGTGVGGSANSTDPIFRVGDDASNAQYRGILSFDTSTLPDAVTIVLGRLRVRQSDMVGTDPFTTHGALHMNLATSYFGSAWSLAAGDFEAAATVSGAGNITNAPSAGWYTGTLKSAGYAAVDKAGTTQFRLRFATATDGDSVADYQVFYSGDAASINDVPRLLVYYNP